MSPVADLGPVVHPTDLSGGARAAFPYSLYLASLFGTDLHLLHVRAGDGVGAADAGFPSPGEESERVGRWLSGRSGDAAGAEPSAGSAALPAVHREVRRGGEPASRIVSYASEVEAGALCMGTHGRRGMRRLVLGSVTETVIRRARSPVLTVRRGVPGWPDVGPRLVLAAVDLSPMMEPALAWAGLVAAASGAGLRAVHVVTSPAGAAVSAKRQRLHRAFEELDITGVELETEMLAGDPADRIAGAAEGAEADLVVAATHGRSGPSRLVLGSVSESLVRRAPCPVLTVSDPRSVPATPERREAGGDA